jgi:hypothetical protein
MKYLTISYTSIWVVRWWGVVKERDLIIWGGGVRGLGFVLLETC